MGAILPAKTARARKQLGHLAPSRMPNTKMVSRKDRPDRKLKLYAKGGKAK